MLIKKIQIDSIATTAIIFTIPFCVTLLTNKINCFEGKGGIKIILKFACSHMHMMSQKWECRRR